MPEDGVTKKRGRRPRPEHPHIRTMRDAVEGLFIDKTLPDFRLLNSSGDLSKPFTYGELLSGARAHVLILPESVSHQDEILDVKDRVTSELGGFPLPFEVILSSTLRALYPAKFVESAKPAILRREELAASASAEKQLNNIVEASIIKRVERMKAFLTFNALVETQRYDLNDYQYYQIRGELGRVHHTDLRDDELNDLVGMLRLPQLVDYVVYRLNYINTAIQDIRRINDKESALVLNKAEIKKINKRYAGFIAQLSGIAKGNLELFEQLTIFQNTARNLFNVRLDGENHEIYPANMSSEQVPGVTGFLGRKQVFFPTSLPARLQSQGYSLDYRLPVCLFGNDGQLKRRHNGEPEIYIPSEIRDSNSGPLRLTSIRRTMSV